MVAVAVLTGLVTAAPAGAASPRPAGAQPSTIARMVCEPKAVGEINALLGQQATVVDKTWVKHVYSCDYVYSDGTMVLSVKELSSWSQTLSYFKLLATKLGKQMNLYGLGQGAFKLHDGSVVVRKDWKVLVVNTAGLPASFTSSTNTNDVALSVAAAIMECWHGD